MYKALDRVSGLHVQKTVSIISSNSISTPWSF